MRIRIWEKQTRDLHLYGCYLEPCASQCSFWDIKRRENKPDAFMTLSSNASINNFPEKMDMPTNIFTGYFHDVSILKMTTAHVKSLVSFVNFRLFCPQIFWLFYNILDIEVFGDAPSLYKFT